MTVERTLVIDTIAVDALRHRTLGPEHKGLPPRAWGCSAAEFVATRPTLAEFATPILSLDRGRIDSNLRVMADWADAAGVRLAPHGKTTMAPQLWKDQLDSGSWAITLATGWQVQVARSFGVRRILLANALVDPVTLQWISRDLDAHEWEFSCWADSVDTVARMESILSEISPRHPIRVIVELGGDHGRTGARTLDAARAVADAVSAATHLTLAGVGGYEGALSHDRTDSGLDTVRRYLDAVGTLHADLVAAGRYDGHAVITAGGSAYPDLVIEQLASLADEDGIRGVPTSVVLRSGAYVIHDDGFYAGISPLIPERSSTPLTSAMHGWARAVSHPEPGLALLDAGKRDLPFDEGLPVPQRLSDGTSVEAATISALNDQHAFLRLPDALDSAVPVGTVVRLGLSHPCTAFDKWRVVPVVDDADAADPRVVDLVHTFF